MTFKCERCGACCLGCPEYEEDKRNCKIYPNRPLVCRVDDLFKALELDKIMAYATYIETTQKACKELRQVVKTKEGRDAVIRLQMYKM